MGVSKRACFSVKLTVLTSKTVSFTTPRVNVHGPCSKRRVLHSSAVLNAVRK